MTSLDPILTILGIVSGWLAFLLTWHQYRRNRPRLRFVTLECLKDPKAECLLTYAAVANYGTVAAHICAVDYIIYDCGSSKVVDRGPGWWHTEAEDASTKDHGRFRLAEILPFGRRSFVAEFLVYTTAIITDDPKILRLYPTLSDSSGFYILVVVTYGNCQKVFRCFKVSILRRIEENMTAEEALGCLKVRRRRVMYPIRTFRSLVNDHDTYLKTLLEGGLSVMQ